MKYEIIKADGYLLVVDDSEIKTWYYDEYSKKVHHSGGAEYSRNDITKNIVAHLPLNGFAILKDIPLLPPLNVDDDIEELAEQKYSEQSKSYENDLNDPFYNYPKYLKIGFVDGYNKAKECERNNLTPFKNLITLIENGLLKGTIETNLMIDQEINVCKEYLNKQSQPGIPTHFEVEMREYVFFDCDSIIVEGEEPKTTTNSQGQTQLVGRYIYE